MENINEINSETKTRIFSAADKLYAACNREAFPTVDAVRREAKAGMGDVSSAMKAWRKAQTAQAVVQDVQAPDAILQSAKVLVSEVWTQAHDLASESLRTAQQAWDAERAEAELLRAELGQAFDDQASELDSVKQERDSLDQELETAHVENEDLCIKIDSLTKDLSSSQKKIDDQSSLIVTLEAQIKDMQMQASELSKKLDAVTVEKNAVEKQSAIFETKLAAESDKVLALDKAHSSELEKVALALQEKGERLTDALKTLDTAELRIATLEKQAIHDREQVDALSAETLRLANLLQAKKAAPNPNPER